MNGMRDLMPFLMFCGDQHGKAEEAIHWYCSIFDDSRVTAIDRYGPADNEPEGTVRTAMFEVGGHAIRAIDSAAPHAFTFTPAISLWIECSSLDELERVSTALGAGGTMLMPPDNYGFSARFCWVADRYGVTWQLNFTR
jgi:predicted 3-demethylubiquinone-9 3-methyltransferase (glyoxalase superfamily)